MWRALVHAQSIRCLLYTNRVEASPLAFRLRRYYLPQCVGIQWTNRQFSNKTVLESEHVQKLLKECKYNRSKSVYKFLSRPEISQLSPSEFQAVMEKAVLTSAWAKHPSLATNLLREMITKNLKLDVKVCNTVVKSCAHSSEPEDVANVVKMLNDNRFPLDNFLLTTSLSSLLQIFRSTHSIVCPREDLIWRFTEDVINVFRTAGVEGDSHSWTTLLRLAATCNKPDAVSELTNKILNLSSEDAENCISDAHLFGAAVHSCIETGLFLQALQIDEFVRKSGSVFDVGFRLMIFEGIVKQCSYTQVRSFLLDVLSSKEETDHDFISKCNFLLKALRKGKNNLGVEQVWSLTMEVLNFMDFTYKSMSLEGNGETESPQKPLPDLITYITALRNAGIVGSQSHVLWIIDTVERLSKSGINVFRVSKKGEDLRENDHGIDHDDTDIDDVDTDVDDLDNLKTFWLHSAVTSLQEVGNVQKAYEMVIDALKNGTTIEPNVLGKLSFEFSKKASWKECIKLLQSAEMAGCTIDGSHFNGILKAIKANIGNMNSGDAWSITKLIMKWKGDYAKKHPEYFSPDNPIERVNVIKENLVSYILAIRLAAITEHRSDVINMLNQGLEVVRVLYSDTYEDSPYLQEERKSSSSKWFSAALQSLLDLKLLDEAVDLVLNMHNMPNGPITTSILLYTTLVDMLSGEEKLEACAKVLKSTLRSGIVADKMLMNGLLKGINRRDKQTIIPEQLNDPKSLIDDELLSEKQARFAAQFAMWTLKFMLNADLEPDMVTYSCVVRAIARINHAEAVLSVIDLAENSGLEPNVYWIRAAANSLWEIGLTEQAVLFLKNKLASGYPAPGSLYTALFTEISDEKDWKLSLDLAHSLDHYNISMDPVMCTIIIKSLLYGHKNHPREMWDNAEWILSKVKNNLHRDLLWWLNKPSPFSVDEREEQFNRTNQFLDNNRHTRGFTDTSEAETDRKIVEESQADIVDMKGLNVVDCIWKYAPAYTVSMRVAGRSGNKEKLFGLITEFSSLINAVAQAQHDYQTTGNFVIDLDSIVPHCTVPKPDISGIKASHPQKSKDQAEAKAEEESTSESPISTNEPEITPILSSLAIEMLKHPKYEKTAKQWLSSVVLGLCYATDVESSIAFLKFLMKIGISPPRRVHKAIWKALRSKGMNREAEKVKEVIISMESSLPAEKRTKFPKSGSESDFDSE